MKTIVVIFTLFLMQNETFAQTVVPNASNPVKNQVGNPNVISAPNINTVTPEPIPTPEQQGFTKFVLSNGKIKYIKKAGDVTIEYTPK